ncbi:MAG TPA: DUF2062 domain-containing protein, partial [Desulfobulbaceae bacterium]|nr:DUF2062 domain-containing protein [Desulfobulbaceae bacterium]
VTTLPIYYLAYRIGNLISPHKLYWYDIKHKLEIIGDSTNWSQILHVIMSMSWETAVILFVGSLVFALPCAALAYTLSLKLFTQLRRKRTEKHILRAKRR